MRRLRPLFQEPWRIGTAARIGLDKVSAVQLLGLDQVSMLTCSDVKIGTDNESARNAIDPHKHCYDTHDLPV